MKQCRFSFGLRYACTTKFSQIFHFDLQSEKLNVDGLFVRFFVNFFEDGCVQEGVVVDKLQGANAPELASKVAKWAAAPTTDANGKAAPAVPNGVKKEVPVAPPAVPSQGAGNGTPAEAEKGKLHELVNSKKVMLFMKGTPEEPRCGFSRKVVNVLNDQGVEFGSFDILSDETVRQGMKTYANWPTFPQLYVEGELLGGCDIILEMNENGELKEVRGFHFPLCFERNRFLFNFSLEINKARFGYDLFTSISTLIQYCSGWKLSYVAWLDFSIWAMILNTSNILKISFFCQVFAEKGILPKESLESRLKNIINQSTTMLFMKGTPDAPRCGFSTKVVNALKEEGVEFGSFNILEDEEVRQGLKTYSNWPTYPQLYYKGELLGGCDIVLEMKANGELKETLTE